MNEPFLSSRELKCARLHAVDGEIGDILSVYFDVITWQVRYLLVRSGDWLKGRKVVISPLAIGDIDAEGKNIIIELSLRDISNSPAPGEDDVITRDFEQAYIDYYNWPGYWEVDSRLSADDLLRREYDIQGYCVKANDGRLGEVRELILDTCYWSVRYLDIQIGD